MKKFLICMVFVIILSLLTCGVIYIYKNNLKNEENTETIENTSKEEDVITEEKEKKEEIEVDEGPSKGYRTIALFGNDSRYDDYATDYRTDCIMVAVINNETKEVTLFSIYRDTYLEMELDGKTILNKVNQAYYNGIENSLKTINKNLDLNITEYAQVNFSSLSDIIDAIGGVDIDVDADELKYINNYIKDTAGVAQKPEEMIFIEKPGFLHLNGVQAVAYCRIRYTEGWDYKRTERMREVLTTACDKIKKLNLIEMSNLADKLLPEVMTNIPKKDLLGFTKLKITNKFGWPYNTKGWENGDFYGPPITLESNVLRLHKEIYGDENYVVPDSVKEISNKIIKKTGYK